MKFKETKKRKAFGAAAAAAVAATFALTTAGAAFAQPTDNTPPQPGSLAYCMSGGWTQQQCAYYDNQPWAYSTGG